MNQLHGRELNRVSAMVQLTPTEAWAMTAQFWSQDEDFDEVPLGLLSAKSRTFSVEADLLIKDGHVTTAVAYVTATLVVGLLSAWLGIRVGRR